MKRIAALLTALLMICGCSKSAESDLREIDVVLDWYPNAIHAFIYTAIENGYYADEGLKVNIRFPSGVNDALSLVAAGRAEIGIYYQQDSIMARANQSVPIKSIGTIVHSPLNVLLSLKEKGITSPSDLVGKRIGYAATELSEAVVRSMMENAGVDSSQIEMIDVGFDLMSAMTTGQVDATVGCLLNHEVPQLEKEGFEVNVVKLTDCGIPNYYEAVFLSSDKLIETDSEMLKKFLRASKKGFEDMKSDPEKSLEILLKNQSADSFPLTESVERESMALLLPLMENSSCPFLSQNDEVWRENIDWLYSNGLISEKPQINELYSIIG